MAKYRILSEEYGEEEVDYSCWGQTVVKDPTPSYNLEENEQRHFNSSESTRPIPDSE